jgi:hypothetical protein
MPTDYDPTDLRSMEQATKWLAERMEPPTRMTMRNWAIKGILDKRNGERFKLRVEILRGVMLTTRAWVNAFVARYDDARRK